MGGSIQYDKSAKRFYIDVWWDKKHHKIWDNPHTGEKFYDRRQAQKILGSIQDEVDCGTFNPNHWKPDSPLIVKEYYKEWLSGISVSVKTKRDYEGYIVNHVIPEIGGMDIRHIRHKHLSALYSKLRGKLSDKGAYNVMGGLKAMLKWAWRSEDIREIPPFPALGFQLPEISYLTIEQQAAILGKIPERHRPIFEIGMEFGLRTQEARALMKDCIADGVVIKRSFAENELQEHTKTRDIRYFGMTAYAKAIFESIEPHLSQFVFVREDGRPYTNKNLNAIWSSACAEAGINIKLQAAFRHSLGCQLLDQGESLDLVQDALGHTTQGMTRRYAKRNTALISDAIENRRKVVPFRVRSGGQGCR